MSAYLDQRGVAYSAASQEAVDRFDATITEYVHFGTDTGARLKETLTADPGFPMAHCLRGVFMQLFSVAALTEKAKQSLAKARETGATHGVSEREQHHIEALGARLLDAIPNFHAQRWHFNWAQISRHFYGNEHLREKPPVPPGDRLRQLRRRRGLPRGLGALVKLIHSKSRFVSKRTNIAVRVHKIGDRAPDLFP